MGGYFSFKPLILRLVDQPNIRVNQDQFPHPTPGLYPPTSMLTMTAKRIGFGIETPTGHFTMDYNKAIAEWGKVTACFFLTPVSSNLSKADENLLRESIIRSFQDGSCSPKPADKPFRRSIQIVAPIGLIKIKSQVDSPRILPFSQLIA
jgi:hypothetical protein